MPKSTIVRSRSEACVDAGKGFVSNTGPHSVVNGDNRFAKFVSGSTKVVRITRIICAADANMRFRITQAPTTTADGSAQSVLNRRMGKGQTNQAVLYYGPTVTTEGTVVYDFWMLAGDQKFLEFGDSPWVLDPGNSILVTVAAGGANNASFGIEWDEEPV